MIRVGALFFQKKQGRENLGLTRPKPAYAVAYHPPCSLNGPWSTFLFRVAKPCHGVLSSWLFFCKGVPMRNTLDPRHEAITGTEKGCIQHPMPVAFMPDSYFPRVTTIQFGTKDAEYPRTLTVACVLNDLDSLEISFMSSARTPR
jgi:hypothetical protein